MSDEIHALSGAYAVDALDEIERARFERHLAGCAACRVEVESLRVAAAELSSITEIPPPASLRAGVLSGIRMVRPLPPLAQSQVSDLTDRGRDTDTISDTRADQSTPGELSTGSIVTGVTDGTDAADAPTVPIGPTVDRGVTDDGDDRYAGVTSITRASERREARRSPWRGLVAAGAAAVLALGTFGIWRTVAGNDAPRTVAEQVLDASDATKTVHSFANGGSATVVRSASLGKAVLVGTDLPTPGSGKTYQLWLQSKDEKFTSAGLVPGEGNQVVLLEGDAANAAAAGITIEPAGGSKQPTVQPLALFPFSA